MEKNMTPQQKLNRVYELMGKINAPPKMESKELIELIGAYSKLCGEVADANKNLENNILVDKQIVSSSIFGFLKQEKLEEIKNKKSEKNVAYTNEMLKILDLDMKATKGHIQSRMKMLQAEVNKPKPN